MKILMTIAVLMIGLNTMNLTGCALLGTAAELSGHMVWNTCELPQANRQQVKMAVEGEAQQHCIDDGQFTALECQSISLSFGCPQDVVVP